MRKLFWLAAAFFSATSVHAAFVLAVPSFTLERTIARISADTGSNSFFILPADEQSRLFPAYSPLSVVGACAFDVSQGPVDLTANMAPGFWTLTIYSSTGDVIYSLNDAQAGTAQFTVSLKQAPGIWEMLNQSTQLDAATATGWNVGTADPKGLAVLWQPVAEPALRPLTVRNLGRASCGAAG